MSADRVQFSQPMWAHRIADGDLSLVMVSIDPRAVITDLAVALLGHADDLRRVRLPPSDLSRVAAIRALTSDPAITSALTLVLGCDQAEQLAEDLDTAVVEATP